MECGCHATAFPFSQDAGGVETHWLPLKPRPWQSGSMGYRTP